MSNLNIYNDASGRWEEIHVDTRLNVLKNTITLSANANFVFIGITNFNPADDTLIVVKDKGVLAEGVDYTFNSASLKVYSKDGSNWSKDSVFTFTVWKNVKRTLPSADGSLLQDGSVTELKLAEEIRISPALTDSNGIKYNTLQSRLLKLDSDVKKLEKETPFILVSNYESDVVNLGKSNEDWTIAIQKALDSTPLYKQVILPMQKCRITKTLKIPVGTSLVGFGSSSIIEADYTYWQNQDYRAIYIATREGINYQENTYNQHFENFSVIGKNNAAIESIGIDISTPSSITYDVAVNYSLLFGHFKNVLVSKFDIAWNVVECWMTTFDNLSILDCRIGVNIAGKSVNITFSNIMATNFSSEFTSNAGKKYGVHIDSKFTYKDGNDENDDPDEGRPEGIFFSNCVIYGADTNVYTKRVLFVRFTDCILDGATEDAVVILGPDNATFKGCYIFTSGIGFCGVNLLPLNTSDSKIEISDCYISGLTGEGTSTQYGIYSFSNITVRSNVLINGNKIRGFSDPIHFNRLNGSKITNNYGRGNGGNFIYCQSDGADTILDGNMSDDNYPIVCFHPTTSQNVHIRDNKSKTNSTSFQGFATMKAGTTSIEAPNDFYTSELYYRAVTEVHPQGNLGSVWVVEKTNWSAGTIHCSTAPAQDVKIFYKAIAVPYAATV